ncbi:MAG: ABC transporter ATP-binding protein/permease [Chloroflexi bacterium]|nr:ABC transporter ATP-binding protein/permease [Chloroflexota bacterium]MCI0575214.1 ABC transporter ATP-binding protein/permease [Chloroflexota bacterium]MCI0643826.1 ABC transporter ATP-binding protein/permease [Chloroflexota bacterium]MCI0726076.1 ABC transporter ATP-binding protein/permease [Chloroflexota bacterium]
MQLTQRQPMQRSSRAERQQNNQAMGRAMRYLGRYPRLTLTACIALLVATAAQLAVPELVQRMIDTVLTNATRKNVLDLPAAFQQVAAERLGLDLANLQVELDNAPRALVLAMITIIIFAIARGLFTFAQTYLSQALSQNIAFELRNDLFAKIQRLSFSYHDRNQTGQLMIRATDDVERLRLFIGQGLLMALQALVLLVGTIVILWITNRQLTFVVLPILPIALVSFIIFGGLVQPLFREIQIRLSRVNTILQENLAGFKVVKAFAREPYEQARFGESNDELLEQQLKINRTLSFMFPFIFLIANLGQAAVLYFGGVQIVNGTLTLGEWQKFSLYLVYIFLPMGQLGFIISLMAQAAASAQRIFEILDAKNDVENKPGAIDLGEVMGRVEFDHVTFRYFGGSEPVLRNVSFVAEPGQTIALLGATGSGKTTIINLIPRFYDASEGRVVIDGHDVRDVTIESLRQKIGIVLQETTLFSGTIRENIAFGRPDAADKEIIAAAQAAAAHDFIISFPQGYDTPVGERGSTLSGGQKQRIAIARALLLDPHILILDDSTSSVDLNTEYQIQKALDRLMEGRTSFVIAQRISTVLNADQILVLDQGRIIAQGVHEELLEDSAIYAEIYHSQLEEDVVPG